MPQVWESLILLGKQKRDISISTDVPRLGYKDSNLEMTESESVALPFGDTPMFRNRRYYIIEFFKMQELF